jgi:hypothetical protein
MIHCGLRMGLSSYEFDTAYLVALNNRVLPFNRTVPSCMPFQLEVELQARFSMPILGVAYVIPKNVRPFSPGSTMAPSPGSIGPNS